MAINFQQTDSEDSGFNGNGTFCSGATTNGVITSTQDRACSDGGAAGSTPVTPGLGSNVVDAAGALFICTVAAGVTWAAGTWTVRLNVTTANMNLTWTKVAICRVNSSGVNQESLGLTTGLGISLGSTGVKTATVTGSATTPTAGDKVAVVLVFDNAAMTAQTFSHTPDQLINSPFTAPPPAADNPPFSQRDRSAALTAWQPIVPPPQEYRRLVQEAVPAVVNDPPFGSRTRAIQAGIVTAWHRWRTPAGGGGGAPAAAPDDPPFSLSARTAAAMAIIMAWQPVAAPPQAQRFVPIVVAQAADDPPFTQRSSLPSILASWQPDPPTPQTLTPRQILSVDDPAFGGRTELPGILRTWQPSPPPPQAKPPTQIVSVDDPPWSSRQRIDQAAWEPPQWPQRARVLLPQGVDDPPFGSRAASNQVAISAAWYRWRPPSGGGGGQAAEAPADNPPFARLVVQPAQIWYSQPDTIVEISLSGLIDWPHDPPFGQRSELSTILAAWQPTAVPAQRSARLITGVQVDDPPFNARRTIDQAAWLPAVSVPQQPRALLVQETAAVTADDPPFGSRRDIVQAAWQSAAAPQQPRAFVPQETAATVDNPPFGQRTALPNILSAWQLDAQASRELRPAQIVSVDNPPPRGRLIDQSHWWQPPSVQYAKANAPQVVVVAADNPPFGRRPALPSILAMWAESALYKPAIRGPLAIFGVAQNNPPFNQRNQLPNILALWNTPAQQMPPHVRTLTESGPFVPPGPVAELVGGRSSKRQRWWIQYADGQLVEFTDARVYRQAIAAILAKPPAEAAAAVEEIAEIAPPSPRQRRKIVAEFQVRPELLDMLAQKRAAAIIASAEARAREVLTIRRLQIEREDQELMLILSQIV